MQADSNGAPADFSQQLYEQLRYDDVLNKKRLIWYVKLSQNLVNRAILEKIWLLIHATQILGIFWINMFGTLNSWRSPFFPLACDVCSFSFAGARANCVGPVTFVLKALSSNSPGPNILNSNALLWWILFLFPAGSFVCYQWAIFLHRRFTGRISKLPFFHRVTLALTSIFYVPIVFVHVRHITCSSYTLMPAPVLFEGCSDMYLDAIWCSSTCGSSSASGHLALTVLSCFALLLFTLAVPLQYIQILRGCIVSNNAVMYEHNVKANELELITGLSWNYVRRYYYVVASYTRPWAYFCVWLQLLMLGWILLTCLTMHTVSLTFMRSLLLLIPLLLWIAASAFRRPYRLFTSNVCLVCTIVALSLNCTTFTLMASGDKSPFSKFSTMEPFLQLINFTWPCIIILGCFCSVNPLRQFLPQKWARWPVRLDNYQDADTIVDTLSADRDAFSRFYARTPEFVNPQQLIPHIRSMDGLFRSLHQQRHPMSLAVENSLEDWMGLYNSIIKVSLLPYPPLERELPQLRLRCDVRDDYLLLVPRRIKMVLLKLFALRMFIEILQARRALGSKQNARSHQTVALTDLLSVPPPPPPPPSDAQPSLWMHATSFLAREANRVAWRRRNAHLLYKRVDQGNDQDADNGGV